MAEVNLTKDNFDKEVIESKILVLIEFWAAWCGPCQIVAPVVEEIAKEYEGKIKVGKVNVDEQQELAAKYSVMSIPTFMIFKDSRVTAQFTGAHGKERFAEEIKKILK